MSRLHTDLAANRLTTALERLRADGRPIIDLTESNPTRAGFEYARDLLAPLADPRGLTYSPRAFGLDEARRAVAADYLRRGISTSADRIVLTSSTSDAYSLLFKVLCEPGDEVLVPRPSYPLFEHLSRLDAVVAKPYDLEYHGAWTVDLSSVKAALSDRTRAVLIVSPNNPTGSFVTAAELDRIAAISAQQGAAIVADEVFADYELMDGAAAAAGQVLGSLDGLAFSLGGLSKSVGLPQVKLGWMAVAGSAPRVSDALGRLELVCDTYLSVSTPVQFAAAELMRRGAAVRDQIQGRIRANYRHLVERAARTPSCQVLAAEGGWYAIIQVPSLVSEEELVLDLLSRHHVFVHPGYFFDFTRESYLVVSLLTPGTPFCDGISRIFGHFDHTASITPRAASVVPE